MEKIKKSKRERVKKDPGAPKKPMTAFLIYL